MNSRQQHEIKIFNFCFLFFTGVLAGGWNFFPWNVWNKNNSQQKIKNVIPQKKHSTVSEQEHNIKKNDNSKVFHQTKSLIGNF